MSKPKVHTGRLRDRDGWWDASDKDYVTKADFDSYRERAEASANEQHQEIRRLNAVISKLKGDVDAAKQNGDGWAKFGRKTQAERDAALARAEAAEKAVTDEPEVPGDMPDAMWAVLWNDKDAVTQAIRIAVRQTKQNILARLTASAKESP